MNSIPDSLFHKSTYSQPNNNNCVEVADLTGASAVRDTQNRGSGHLMFPATEWNAFLADLKGDQI